MNYKVIGNKLGEETYHSFEIGEVVEKVSDNYLFYEQGEHILVADFENDEYNQTLRIEDVEAHE